MLCRKKLELPNRYIPTRKPAQIHPPPVHLSLVSRWCVAIDPMASGCAALDGGEGMSPQSLCDICPHQASSCLALVVHASNHDDTIGCCFHIVAILVTYLFFSNRHETAERKPYVLFKKKE